MKLVRLLHGLVKLLFTAAIIASGVVLYLYSVSEVYEVIVTHVPDDDMLRQILGGCVAAIAFLTLLPRAPRQRKVTEITFTNVHGQVTIGIEPVERDLQRVVSKLREVKVIALKVKPLEGNNRVRIDARATLYKDAEADARLVTARVNSFMKTHAQKFLGLQDVEVRIKVDRFIVNMKTLKAEPLLLTAPDDLEQIAPQSVMSSPIQDAARTVTEAEAGLGSSSAQGRRGVSGGPATEGDAPSAQVNWNDDAQR